MEREVVMKIRRLKKGDSIAIFPFSRKYGDFFNAVAFPCPGSGPDLPIQIEEPFKAEFISYDDSIIKVFSEKYYCLVMDISFIRDIDLVF